MKKLFCSLFGLVVLCGAMPAFSASEFSCGAGYVLANHAKIDGLNAKECKKLWCRDLETNKAMGSGDRAASGYVDTSAPDDAIVPNVPCFGTRKWCAGEPTGTWDSSLGMYVRGDDDGSTYKSYQKSGCFAWRLEKPECAEGQVARVVNGQWHCYDSETDINNVQKSSVRRTGTMRRIIR